MGESNLHFVSKNAILDDNLTNDGQDRPFTSTPLNIDVTRPKTTINSSPIYSDEREPWWPQYFQINTNHKCSNQVSCIPPNTQN